MKKFILFAVIAVLAIPQDAQADIVIAGWDTWNSVSAPSSTVTATGVTATAAASTAAGNWSIADSGTDPGRGSSEDTTWGTFDGNGNAASAVTNAGTANFTAVNGVTSAQITYTITNNGAVNLDLAAFHMDAVAFRPNAPRTYQLNVLSGDITNGTVFTSGNDAITSLGGSLSGHNQHDDIDLDLTGLADHTLAVGESAVIQIAFSSGTGSGGGHHLFLDNVAFSGNVSTVPEPSGLSVLGLAGITMFLRRKK